MTTPGKFIVFEGPDGVGKTTQAKLLTKWLLNSGYSVWLTHEPTTGPIGQVIRKILRKEMEFPGHKMMAELFTIDRYYHSKDIQFRLNEGTHVICDRYIFSTLAYNCPSKENKLYFIKEHEPFYVKPNIIFSLDAEIDVLVQRKKSFLNETQSIEEIYENIDNLKETKDQYNKMFYGMWDQITYLFDQMLFIDCGVRNNVNSIRNYIFKQTEDCISRSNTNLEFLNNG